MKLKQMFAGFTFLSGSLLALAAAQPVPPSMAAPRAGAAATYPLEAYAAIGSIVARDSRFAELGWTEDQVNAFVGGIRAYFLGNGKPFSEAAAQLSREIAQKIQVIEGNAQPQAAKPLDFSQPGNLEQYFKEIRKQHNLQVTDSGLCYNFQISGSGVRASLEDTVVVTLNCLNAFGTTKVPQLSVENRRMKVADLVPGLAEAIQMMAVGSKAVLVVPPDLLYGNGEWPQGVARGEPLVFLTELHEVVSPDAAP